MARFVYLPLDATDAQMSGASQTGSVVIKVPEGMANQIQALRALDAGPGIVSLITASVLQALEALDLNLEVTAQLNIAGNTFALPKVRVHASDIADISVQIASILASIGASFGAQVGSMPASGFAPAATAMTALAARSSLWP
jgi:hypothetical protein